MTVRALLRAHPSTPNEAVRRLAVELRAEESDILAFHYSLEANMSRLRVPSSGVGGRVDGLWKHTCFEAFVASTDVPCYYEFNFSPSLDWAVYRFSAYREGMSLAEIGQAPTISVTRSESGLELKSAVSFAHLPELRDAHRLRLGLAAVIEDDKGALSYWGLRHAPARPDFHHPDGFALEVARA